jgi:NADH-quinone oxidoreductase subunit A
MLREYLPILVFWPLPSGSACPDPRRRGDRGAQPRPRKVSAYECGFNAFDDARMKFDVRFYLVSILFIIFDLEIAFLFPWAVAFQDLSMTAFWSMMVFLGRADRRLCL